MISSCYCFVSVIPHHFCYFSDDPVYMPHEAQLQEYIKSDYGLVFMGTNLNVCQRPWSFGQVCNNRQDATIMNGLCIITDGQNAAGFSLCFIMCSMSLGS